jgi:hypothetical protein
MREIEALGVLSVRRGCAFGALAIGTLMFGFMNQPAIAFGIGAISSVLVALILLLKRNFLARTDYRKTELWVMLPRDRRPPGNIASQVVPRILGEAYLAHCRLALMTGAFMAVFSIGCHLGQ